MAWGSLAREVPRRNLRSFCFVSSEKVYSLDSEDCGAVSGDSTTTHERTMAKFGRRGISGLRVSR